MMRDAVEMQPVAGDLDGTIQPPGSKSITNRALLIAALANGQSCLRGALESDDTRVMIESLTRLGIVVNHDADLNCLNVIGAGGRFPRSSAELFVENSGTTIRFLTAALAVTGGSYRLDGVSRMRERPIGPLVDSLAALGANIVAESPGQCPPVRIDSARLAGGHAKIRGDLSSQYLSGLLMAAPLAEHAMSIEIEGQLISRPYLQMTLELMRSFGVECCSYDASNRFEISALQKYQARDYQIEPDASAASYFWAAAAICGGRATVRGLNRYSLQGDVGFTRCLRSMGCELIHDQDSITIVGPAKRGIVVDMSDASDTVQTLAAVALFVSGSTTIRNVAHNRIKETDRIGNLAIELRKFGAHVEEFGDGLTITPGPLTGAKIETYHDHRMAMSLALVGLRVPGVSILNPDCVAKTFPDYFAALEKFCRPG